jgi:hypothetical protein
LNTDDCCVNDVGVRHENAFELGGCDLEGADFNEFLAWC